MRYLTLSAVALTVTTLPALAQQAAAPAPAAPAPAAPAPAAPAPAAPAPAAPAPAAPPPVLPPGTLLQAPPVTPGVPVRPIEPVTPAPPPDTVTGPTPPIVPNTQPVPIPPPVELPAPPAGAVVVPPASGVGSEALAALTADEAARIALYLQPNVTLARAGILAAQGAVTTARSAALPQVGVAAGYAKEFRLAGNPFGGGSAAAAAAGGAPVVVPNSQTSVSGGVSLSQLLLDFGRTRSAVRQAQAQQRAAQAGLTVTQSDTVLLVKQGFYTYVQNLRLVAVQQANLLSRQNELALAQGRLNAGVGLPIDVVRAQTTVADAAFTLDQARNTASVSRVMLAQSMGIDPRTPLVAADSQETPPPNTDVTTLAATAQRQRPEIVQAEAGIEAAREGLTSARLSNAPSVSAALGLNTADTRLLPRNDSFSAGLVFNWTPFNGGLTRGLVQQAQAGLIGAQTTLAQARLTATSDVSQAYLNLTTAEHFVATAAAEVANAAEGVRLAEGRYRGGVGTFIEVTDAQAALVTAQTNQVNAVTAVNTARAALAHAFGAGLPAMR